MATATNPGTDGKTNAFAGVKVPKIDTNALIDSYKKNLEILGLINKMSLEVCNGITKLQSAFVKQLVSDIGSIVEKGAKPSDAFARFSEVARDSVVKAINNSKQISDLITANNNDLTAAITKRFKESIEEAKTLVKK
ncbi:MAG: TIGR01841 family phasin [Holosporaceae bacterium]|jgi:phasin family protein|nr:TIGR01841 family phasin [Holosporaceae bacterium]